MKNATKKAWVSVLYFVVSALFLIAALSGHVFGRPWVSIGGFSLSAICFAVGLVKWYERDRL